MAVAAQRQHHAPGPLTVREILAEHALRPVFQPVLDIHGGGAIRYESLIRGPAGSPLERPDLLFAAARDEDLLAELDAQCRLAAFEEAARHDLGRGTTLFVNVEPETLDSSSAEALARGASLLPEGIQTVAEITERSLAAEPAALVRSVGELRRAGIGIALDDVGADDRSLALMPLLRPDVIKLDLHFTDSVHATYTELAARMAFVGVLGAEMPARPAPYVRGGHLVEGDPVRDEWDVAVISPHFAATLVARDLGDGGPDDDRRFDFIVSHNRDLAVEAARTLLRRIAGEREPAPSTTRAQVGLGVTG